MTKPPQLTLIPRLCGMVLCPRHRHLDLGLERPFCAEHLADFEASTEGQHRRPSSASDYRDRVWKERCKLDEETKRAQLERDAREKAKP